MTNMHRRKVLALLYKYSTNTVEERIYKELMITFINEHPDCFNRSEEVGHITASSLLLNKEGDKALLTLHKKLNKWLQLGGHCDGNNDVLEVAIKEAREESGINNIKVVFPDIFDLDIHRTPGTLKEKAHYHYDIRFLLQITGKEDEIRLSKESHQLKWFRSSEYLEDEKNVDRLFDKWAQLVKNSRTQTHTIFKNL